MQHLPSGRDTFNSAEPPHREKFVAHGSSASRGVMATHQSPFSASETASCSTPGYSADARKRKRSISGSQPAREYGLMRDTGEHDVARFVGSSSGIHYIRAVYLRLARRSATRTTQATTINTLIPGEDDQLRQATSTTTNREKPLWKAHEVVCEPGVSGTQPSFEDLVEWSRSFFESWHPALPFLHGPDTLRIFEDASKGGSESVPPLDRVILKSILSISLADGRQGPPLSKPIPSTLVFQSVDDAVASSQFALSQPASIRATQAALAIQLFLTSMLCLNAASRLGGLIVRMAFHLGLHRCPTRFPFFTAGEASIRRRVFWCIYTLERLLCQSLGLPLDIQDDDLDVCYPGEEHHGGPADAAEGAEKLQLLTFLAKHARIRGLILEMRNKNHLKRRDTAERAAFVQTELAKWSNEIQDIVEEDDEAGHSSDTEIPSRPQVSPSHRLMLLVLKHESMICLNRPGLASETSSPSYSSAFQACISAAKSICIIFKRHRKRHRLDTNDTERRLAMPLLWPSFTWAVWISTFVLVHAAFESQVLLDSALRHVKSGKEMLGHLAARDTAWPEYCLEAVDELIAAVQELSCPLPQDATEALASTQALHRTVTSQSAISKAQENTAVPKKGRGTTSGWDSTATGVDTGQVPGGSLTEPGVSTHGTRSSGPEAHLQHQNAAPSRTFWPSQPDAHWRERLLRGQSCGITGLSLSGSQATSANHSGVPGTQTISSSHMTAEPLDAPIETGPVEGQESMMWYDQLFASSFSAIDNPFLVAAEFDASIDPTWNYLRLHRELSSHHGFIRSRGHHRSSPERASELYRDGAPPRPRARPNSEPWYLVREGLVRIYSSKDHWETEYSSEVLPEDARSGVDYINCNVRRQTVSSSLPSHSTVSVYFLHSPQIMATSGSVFSDTLQEITNTKLDELSKRRSGFEQAKSSLLVSVQAEEDAVKRLAALSRGVKECFAIKLDDDGKVQVNQTKYKRLEIELQNVDRFLGQAQCDPSISAKMLDAWEKSLHRHLDMQSLTFQYASLYGQLVTEWLSCDKEDDTTAGGDVEMGEAFEDVGSAEKLESRMEWEKTVFEPANVDENALEQYLHRLFGADNDEKKATYNALKRLRDAVHSFESQISSPNQFNISTLRWVIRGLHSSDLLSDEKREALSDFEGNTVILHEIADVLNMRISALGSWTWSSEAGVPVEMRRKISGIYNIHMHEDLLQAIFLHYIGVKWSVFFKRAFTNFRNADGAWKSPRQEIPKEAKQRLGYYLGTLKTSPCLQNSRASKYKKNYFMAQLMNHEEEITEAADGDEEADYERSVGAGVKRKGRTKQTARKSTGGKAPRMQLASQAARKSATRHRAAFLQAEVDSEDEDEDEDGEDEEEEEEEEENVRNPMELKQTLLHLLSTEVTINTRLYGEVTAFHSVFESWNPILPHETTCTVLKYLGVSDTWVGFFKKFLQAPLRFLDDGKSTPARKRRRGTPASHVLSDVFGETTLFCLDFAINQSTSGNPLWRMHDNIWFWSRDHSVAVIAWKTVEEFTAVTGTETNPARTGTVRVSRDPKQTLQMDKYLPEGEIRWGFLRLSPQTGRFEIDQTMVDSHVEELRKQLHDKRKSILGFIQAWNTYATTFFTSNFGKPANCFGREHVNNMLATHERLQREIFSTLPGEGGEKVSSVAEYLKGALGQRFGISDVPDGYLYFPMELGGLDVQSPFISLLQIRDEVTKSPSELLDALEQAERDSYERAKAAFLDGSIKQKRRKLDDPSWAPSSARDREAFMPFDEYVRYREDFCLYSAEETRLHDVFRRLMQRPKEKSVASDDSEVWTAHSRLGGQSNPRGITSNWYAMEPYWRWVSMMYGPEIVERFGGLGIVDPGLLPMGMVTLFRDKRVKW
ncbi:hypothetical protein AK830_g7150 [Neonectria ditissima]|uniref:Xylanolytic transcriptional activator regulatory domain-containing protein n=1 Tax=Neonectria ditissima TaxID=78410 RepID=A0A0P7ANL8_9HYPO|nr:hypothetical protein AK830_g7150 [Neonectria ditissima]